MTRNQLNRDLLHSGKYRKQVVKPKKGKGAYSRKAKHLNHKRHEGAFFMALLRDWLTTDIINK